MGDMDWQVRIRVSATENKDIRRITVDVFDVHGEDDDHGIVSLDAFTGRY
jgi:hypothetical protein